MYEYDGVSGRRAVNVFKQFLFWGIHIAALLIFWTGFSWTALAMCLTLYLVRMFAITGAFHRYFAHRSYKTSRWFQFLLGFIGTTSAQKGPIWWASHHRHHHQHSDTPEDIHPPAIYGLWWAHVGWVLSSQYLHPRLDLVRDFARFPEIQWLDKYHYIPPIFLALSTFAAGEALATWHPALGTNGIQMLAWGFFLSTVLVYHGTFCINSFAHLIGTRRFNTTDDSRNNFWLSLVTLGEGWHNNHHRYPGSVRQGFYWWEIDITHYILKILSWCGLVWDLRNPPERVYREAALLQSHR